MNDYLVCFFEFLPQVEHPLFMEMIDLAISVLPVDAGPQHVKLLLEWNEPDEFFCDTSDAFVEHESVSQLQVCHNYTYNHIIKLLIANFI